jgi:acyl dehydratase
LRTFKTLDDVASAVGEELGTSEWLEIDQDRINQFADATGDHQWIHVDEQRAAEGPFGKTIAHGFLTLSLIPLFNQQVFQLETPGAKLNYGLNKVRFPSPVPVGSKLRDRITLTNVTDMAGGKQITLQHVLEIEGAEKPACIAEMLVLLLP